MNDMTAASDISFNRPLTTLQHRTQAVPSLRDLLEDGIYLLFLLRSKNAPISAADFNQRIDQYLATFERVCRNFDKPLDAIVESKYAFCALLDEIVLSSGLGLRDEWEQAPLQLRLFGEHLAGEVFFEKLDIIRQEPEKNVELLEIFHTCLLLGFQGKYLLEGTEKLNYLIARVGHEIAAVRGPSKGFAPNWKIPLTIQEYVRHELPLWLYYAAIAVLAIGIFLGFQALLNNQLERIPGDISSELIPPAAIGPPKPGSPDAQPALQAQQQAASIVNEAAPQNAGKLKDSKAAREAEAELKREAESEAAYIQSTAKSKAASSVRSLYR
jgi:type VI secretion system protein ImpK